MLPSIDASFILSNEVPIDLNDGMEDLGSQLKRRRLDTESRKSCEPLDGENQRSKDDYDIPETVMDINLLQRSLERLIRHFSAALQEELRGEFRSGPISRVRNNAVLKIKTDKMEKVSCRQSKNRRWAPSETRLISKYACRYPYSSPIALALSFITGRSRMEVMEKMTTTWEQIRKTVPLTSNIRDVDAEIFVRLGRVRSLCSSHNLNPDQIMGTEFRVISKILNGRPDLVTSNDVSIDCDNVMDLCQLGLDATFSSVVGSGGLDINSHVCSKLCQFAGLISPQLHSSMDIFPSLKKISTISSSSDSLPPNFSTRHPSYAVDGDEDSRFNWYRADLSGGLEIIPIPASNKIDSDVLPPLGGSFNYLSCRIEGEGVAPFYVPDATPGCLCGPDGCTDSSLCACLGEMNGKFPYENGRLLNWPIGMPIYECNPSCLCSKSCRNRLVQHGIQVQLEVKKTANKGWGLFTKQAIPAGSFVCEYVGEVITTYTAELRGERYDRMGCSHLFDLDPQGSDHCEYSVDATMQGNIARYINHSCDPNLQNYQIWIECLDVRLPRIALFASREILPLEELTFDYKYDLSVKKTHKLRCYCCATNCRKFLC